MTSVTAFTTTQPFWNGLMTGVWVSATLIVVAWLVRVNLLYRQDQNKD